MKGLQKYTLAFEQKWGIRLPDAFPSMYREEEPMIGGCSFYPLEDVLDGATRWRGMYPYFLPIAEDTEGAIYGFHTRFPAADGGLSILQWTDDTEAYTPVSSGFSLFLQFLAILGAYYSQDEEDIDAAPHNERELFEQLVATDRLGVYGLLNLGCVHFAEKKIESARKLFQSAADQSSWYADSHCLLAILHLQKGDEPAAIGSLLRAIKCAVPLSTNLLSYSHAGLKLPEMEMQEWAADQLVHLKASLSPEEEALVNCLFNTSERLSLAAKISGMNDPDGEERERLNALALAVEESEIDAAYDSLCDYYDRQGNEIMMNICSEDRKR
jgi:tetratricopeptide (TPR) repeat protein